MTGAVELLGADVSGRGFGLLELESLSQWRSVAIPCWRSWSCFLAHPEPLLDPRLACACAKAMLEQDLAFLHVWGAAADALENAFDSRIAAATHLESARTIPTVASTRTSLESALEEFADLAWPPDVSTGSESFWLCVVVGDTSLAERVRRYFRNRR